MYRYIEYVPGIIVGTGNITLNKRDKNSCPHNNPVQWEKIKQEKGAETLKMWLQY